MRNNVMKTQKISLLLDSETSTMMGVNDLMFHPDARQDPYLTNPDLDDDASDVDDVQIRPTDNLILVGHVEGDHSILEVYGKKNKIKYHLHSLLKVNFLYFSL